MLSRSHSDRVYRMARVLDAVGRAFHGDARESVTFSTGPIPCSTANRPSRWRPPPRPERRRVLNVVWRAEAGVAV